MLVRSYPGAVTDSAPDDQPTRRARTPQLLRPRTAADKLGVHLPATPAEFQEGMVSRDELAALEADPPQWLQDLRRDGPHPRQVVAARLRVSRSGLVRAGLTDPLTTEQVEALVADPPEWLVRERQVLRQVKAEDERLAERRAATDPDS